MKYKNKKLQITCDGGAATGKSTGAKLIAKKYKLAFLSSGLDQVHSVRWNPFFKRRKMPEISSKILPPSLMLLEKPLTT